MSAIRVHDVTLHTNHRVLDDVARDMARCLSGPVGRELDVFVGTHAYKTDPPETGGLRIGIQTEHVLDHRGKGMCRAPSRGRLQRFLQTYDLLLDLSYDNEPAYAGLPPELLAKVRFGPHIFPGHPVDPVIGVGPPLFFGRKNDRRNAIMDRLQATRPVVAAPHATFGGNLAQMLEGHGAVLNLHFEDGEYVEYPRLLKAYLFGKPMLSERLSPPILPGLHYYDLTDEVTEPQTRAIFANLATFARAHSFQSFLEAAVRDLGSPQAPA